jgi:hypothetical protein
MIQNLPEDFLYDRLPDALIDIDERGLIQAVVGGIQDRIEDLRAYGKNMQQFFAVNNFPQTGNNVILVDLQSSQGKSYTRSLDIQIDTPPNGSPALAQWAANQLGLQLAALSNVRYGTDLLRLVDTNTLDYLASTIGAVLYQTSIVPASGVQAEQQRLIATYFPRLKIKGTAKSFDALGRALGFDDVRMTPLWSRLSVREPNDIGAPANDPDFGTEPDYIPQQHFDQYYDPLKTDDGSFYTWSGTANNGTASTQFYTQSINGFSPYISVVVLGVQNGTVASPANGTYLLGSSGTESLGGPHKKAYVDPHGSTLRFQALAEGPTFNGMVVSVGTDATGTNTTLTISDRLSAIKYRSSFFDLSITADPNKIEEVFGSSAAQRNKDLANNPTLTPDGTAVSPFRPWVSGSITTGIERHDFVTQIDQNTATVIIPRTEATAVNRQLNVEGLIAAGVQVTQAMEEVRPATRIPRHSLTGLMLSDTVPYAAYGTAATIFATNGTALAYTGSYAFTPLPTYTAAIDVVTTNGTSTAVAEISRTNQAVYNYALPGFSGTYNFSNGTYQFAFVSAGTGTNVVARWALTSTQVIRPEPSFKDKQSGTVAYQFRPEDAQDQELVDEVTDDYPWLRALVGGGELVELDTYIPSTPDVAIDVVSSKTAVQAHTGVDIEVVGIPSSTGHLRLMFQPSPTGNDYEPNRLAIGYKGQFKDLSELTSNELQLVNNENDLETMFEPGYSIYHIGLAQGVLVGDLQKFFAPPHRDGLVGWLPFNEHREDDLAVVDHSSVDGASTLLGVKPTDRTWSDERGWYLNLSAFASVFSDGYRSIDDNQSMSFWLNASGTVTSSVTTILQLGPLSFDLHNGASTLSAYVGTFTSSGPARQLIDTQTVPVGQWTFFYVRKNLNTATFGWGGTLNATGTETSVTTAGTYLPGTKDDTRLIVTAGTLPFGVHDLRVWDTFKSSADMSAVRYHNPTPTLTTYRLGFLETVNKRDRYGFKVLPNGFATTGVMPAWLRTVRLGLVRRYDSTGVYTGEDRFKEVGLGGGRPLPSTYKLGSQFTGLTGAGTTVVATTHGEMPGYNAAWLSDSFAGTYALLTESGSTSNGIVATHPWSGTSSPFPNPMAETNPNRDEIWVKGQDGYVYEVQLYGSLSNTTFTCQRVTRNRSDADLKVNKILQVINSNGSVYAVTAQGTIFPNQLQVTSAGSIISVGTNASTGAVTVLTNGTTVVNILHPLNLRYADQPTGAQVILSGTGTFATVSTAGSFVQVSGGTLTTTPPLYMYLNERIVAAASNAWTQWTDNTNSAAFGNRQIPPVAALNDNGVIELETTGTLLAGIYELDVVSGNVGLPDKDFRGFDVQVTVNASTFPAVLLKNKAGYNVQGTDSFRFTVNDSLIGDWLISFAWTNAYANPATGVARQLAVYSYQLRRLSTELYRVEINTSGTTPKLTQMTTS